MKIFWSYLYILLFIGCSNGNSKNEMKLSSTKHYYKLAITKSQNNTAYIASHNMITKIRKDVDINNNIVAGKKDTAGYIDGDAKQARFGEFGGITQVSNVLYITDETNKKIRKISLYDSKVSTLSLTSNTLHTKNLLSSPQGIVSDKMGNLYVSDKDRHVIFKIIPNDNSNIAQINIFAGELDIKGYRNGIGEQALFNEPDSLLIDDKDNIFVAGSGNEVIRLIKPDGTVSLFAGKVGVEGEEDGDVQNATFTGPEAIYFDQNSNIIILPEGDAIEKKQFTKLRKIELDGIKIKNVDTVDNIFIKDNNLINLNTNLNYKNNSNELTDPITGGLKSIKSWRRSTSDGTGRYKNDHWAWCRQGSTTYDSKSDLKKDLSDKRAGGYAQILMPIAALAWWIAWDSEDDNKWRAVHYVYSRTEKGSICEKKFSLLLRPADGGNRCNTFTNVAPEEYSEEIKSDLETSPCIEYK